MKHLKKITMTLALLMTAATGAWAQTESAFMDVEALGLSSDAVSINSGKTMCSSTNVTMSVAYDCDYKAVDMVSDDDAQNQISIDGVTYDLTKGAQGQTNPTENNLGTIQADGTCMGGQTAGAVYKFNVKADGYLYVFCTLKSNKNYYVWEGPASSQAALLVAYKVRGRLSDGSYDVNIDFPGNDLGYYVAPNATYDDGTKTNQLQTIDPNMGENKKIQGVIAFPVWKDAGEYYVNACGDKIISNGFVFIPGATEIATVGFAKNSTSGLDNALTPDETGKVWTLAAMPKYNVMLEVEYYPQATIATAPAASTETIYMGTTSPLITAGSSEQGTLMYLVSATEPTSTDGFSADLPTAENITEAGDYNVYYYIKGDDTHSDSDIAAEPLLVTVLSDKYDITFEAANDNTIDDGKATVTVGGTAATPTDGMVKAVKMGSEVKIKAKEGYKIKSVEAGLAPVDLSKVTADLELQNGDVVIGTLSANVKITIADGATVTLKGVTINGANRSDYSWAGLTCEGDATIILADGSENVVKGFYDEYPGIFVPENKTLTIKGGTTGDGQLTASSNGYGCGIGGCYKKSCGNIVIEGGIIEATGGYNVAGIGTGNGASCGNITINGGEVTASGGDYAAGIGSGMVGSCGAITISGGKVTAQGGSKAAGIGSGFKASCTSVTITTGVTSVTATKGAESSYCINASKVKIGNGDEITDMSAIYDNGESTFTFPMN